MGLLNVHNSTTFTKLFCTSLRKERRGEERGIIGTVLPFDYIVLPTWKFNARISFVRS